MRYLYEGDKPRRVMHLVRYDRFGFIVGAICNIKLNFNRSINAPFALGRKICKNCLGKTK